MAELGFIMWRFLRVRIQSLANRLFMSCIMAMMVFAREFSGIFSCSLSVLRFLLIHANVLSTTHRLCST